MTKAYPNTVNLGKLILNTLLKQPFKGEGILPALSSLLSIMSAIIAHVLAGHGKDCMITSLATSREKVALVESRVVSSISTRLMNYKNSHLKFSS